MSAVNHRVNRSVTLARSLRSGSPVMNYMLPSLLLTGIALFTAVWWRYRRTPTLGYTQNVSDAASTDPGLLKKHSTTESFHVPATGYTYSIRTFYRDHPQASKLPSTPTPLPLLVFVHGLGGSAAQFSPLLTSLVNAGPCLCIDLPGCGLSPFLPTDWNAYTTDALAEVLAVIISKYRDAEHGQGVVLVGHSMGCSLAVSLASSSPKANSALAEHTLGVIAICPRATPLSSKQESSLRKLVQVPTPLFNLWRRFDRKGGRESTSVRRHVGEDADDETKKLQLRFNEQSQTNVWRRMVHGMLPRVSHNGTVRGLPGLDVWTDLQIPVMLVAGEADTITSPEEVQKISRALKQTWHITKSSTPDAEGLSEVVQHISSSSAAVSSKPQKALKVSILPSPASHALLYAPETCRILCGLIEAFITDHVDQRLSLGWQLAYLSTEGKWDVKNFEKWRKIQPVSEPIGNIFRAMKTMREVDDHHNPSEFCHQWKDKIWTVVDISHESPVYDPRNLENGGIAYNKFPTVSKLPPSEDEVESFCSLIDRLRDKWNKEEWAKPGRGSTDPLIAVHCHYGFNRTGFFIVSYLVSRERWRLQDALDEFEKRRSPGIKHNHFVDALFVRYCAGLDRAPTF
ncbi:hypothetical protein FH972_024456 [Carpinus fangiana]|uniref:Tyrosine specific protein phosphatases domain-containing protein n=1 Tax=Carpinus fangiana TaxID=176857 RepID=A0A5N6KYG1_9ROSI|nr:hypothetical protein FH972_024456 [Carpinus fangiana]